MGLNKESNGSTFVNISEGRLYTKPKGGEKEYFSSIDGTITGVEFVKDTYEGKEFELCKLSMVDGDDKFLVQFRSESGYFRSFVNALRSGDPTKRIKLSPFYKDDKAGMFVQQEGKWLKHYFTKDNPGELPQLKRVRFKGQDVWDGTEQIEYWKKWLLSINWDNSFEAEMKTMPHQLDEIPDAKEIKTPLKDLPF